MNPLDPTDDSAWSSLAAQWRLRPDTLYLNHGSFGPPPIPVIDARREWQRRLDEQPMDFFVRQFTPAWKAARERLAAFVSTAADNLVFVENATAAMNVVANSLDLSEGGEVLLTDHEYGAVKRIWERACGQSSAAPPCVVTLPRPFVSTEQVVDAIEKAFTARTKLLIVSHITSPTAVTLPVAEICAVARKHGILTCVDGPHAPAQIPLDVNALGCDFYCASLHKWLSAPFGSGFLYVAPPHHDRIQTPQKSWGVLQPAQPKTWFDEFTWSGTRDPSPYLTVPTAIDFLTTVGLDAFRARTHFLARYARRRLVELFQKTPMVPDDPAWYAAMAHVPLPPGMPDDLQARLWREHQIEIPIVTWSGERFIRVSCHLYTTTEHVDRLVDALRIARVP